MTGPEGAVALVFLIVAAIWFGYRTAKRFQLANRTMNAHINDFNARHVHSEVNATSLSAEARCDADEMIGYSVESTVNS